MQNGLRRIFLASNSAEGFRSFFTDCYDPRDGWRAYVIKGGPGTGKSTLMKTVAKSAKAVGCDPILVYCSSDPDSLDGVIIEEKKTVLLDGTAPHVVEPTLFGVCERIVTPGDALDTARLENNAAAIIEATDKNKAYHAAAARYLAALAEIKKDELRQAARFLDTSALYDFARRLAAKYFGKEAQSPGKTFNCFIGAYTPQGRVDFTETPALWCKELVITDDKYGAASRYLIRYLSAAAKTAGYDTVRLLDPLFPDAADHLLVPALSVGFVCENKDLHFDVDGRRVRTRRFYNTRAMSLHKNRTRFDRKVTAGLYACAAKNLENAKRIHDEIESFYVGAMDFSALDTIAQKLLKEIFNKKSK